MDKLTKNLKRSLLHQVGIIQFFQREIFNSKCWQLPINIKMLLKVKTASVFQVIKHLMVSLQISNLPTRTIKIKIIKIFRIILYPFLKMLLIQDMKL